MEIKRSSRTDDLFAQELAKAMKAAQKKPNPDAPSERKPDQAWRTDETAEEALKGQNEQRPEKDDDVPHQTMEQQLGENYKPKNAPNAGASGTTERRLNEASQKNYPHRNPDAWGRTGDKRPVNALDEERPQGDGDGDRLKRWMKANAKAPKGPKRVVDKDVGEQMSTWNVRPAETKEAFNLQRKALAKKQEEAARVEKGLGLYLAYKGSSEFMSPLMNEVKDLDSTMSFIMESAARQGRRLNVEEMAKVSALKKRKTELLGIKGLGL